MANAPSASIDPRALLQELEDSIPQGRPNATRFENDDPFAELNLMVDEAMRTTAAEAQYAQDLKAKKTGYQGLTKEEVDFCNSRMAAFEAARIWKPIRNIAVFTKFVCSNCNDQSLLFSRWLQEQQGRVQKTSKRWTPVKEPTKELPNVSAVEERLGGLCIYCASIAGINTTGLKPLQEYFDGK